MSYTQIFGGTTIYPSDVSYLTIALSADKVLEWPLESNDPSNPAARIIDVTATGAYSVFLPEATLTGAGQTILFNNLAASSSSFTLKDYAGGTIATVGVGEQWQVYLADTATPAGTWRVFRYGASTATVQPSSLAGYGLAVTSNTLSQSTPVTTFNSSPRTVLVTDRASMLVWEGTGAGTLNLPSAVSAGNNYIVSVRNSGGGDLTVDAAGSETIDGTATLVLRPGDSTSLTTDGLTWFTLGLGQQAVFAFDYTSITVTGGNYTLAGSELNRIAYEFVGALTSDAYIIVPPTIQQYWISNATTGAYALYLRTASGTPVSVTQGARGIYYCNGTNVVDADTSTVSLPISASDGGTGITNYSIGDLLYANSATTLAKLSDVAVGNALLSGGVGVAPSWGKIGLTTHISGTLPVANGGTGVTTSTGSGSTVLSTSPTLVTPSLGAASATSITNGLGAVGTPSYTFTGDTNTGMWSPAADTIAFSEGGVESMRIISTGDVGIGTTSPGYRLDIAAADTTAGLGYGMRLRANATATGGSFQFTDDAATSQWAYITANTSEFRFAGESRPITFYIGSERMRVGTTGNVTIGTTDDNVNSGVGIKLRAAGTGNPIATVSASSTSAAVGLSMYSTGAAAYRFYVSWDGKINCTSTTIAAISDVRMKENIRDLDYGLATIMALHPCRFDWKEGKGKDIRNDIGFIAQEVEHVMPEMVGHWLPGPDDPEDLKSLSAGELIPVLVKAIQELTARVAQLEGQ